MAYGFNSGAANRVVRVSRRPGVSRRSPGSGRSGADVGRGMGHLAWRSGGEPPDRVPGRNLRLNYREGNRYGRDSGFADSPATTRLHSPTSREASQSACTSATSLAPSYNSKIAPVRRRSCGASSTRKYTTPSEGLPWTEGGGSDSSTMLHPSSSQESRSSGNRATVEVDGPGGERLPPPSCAEVHRTRAFIRRLLIAGASPAREQDPGASSCWRIPNPDPERYRP